ncbi:MAG: type II toxin-antitoxin system RelE/ParE family toxin [DPANN group archaeon]|nr:type II toxin-antitoxin system RelE/ParE family toxin [DPANN group archaeon]
MSSRIFKKLQETKKDPHHYFERLTRKFLYKLRVGKYRIIADIKDKEIVILILYIGHRRNIYKKI